MEEEGGQMERRQIVVFMRHAIAVHNLRDPVTGQPPNLYDPALLDPPLVARGKTAAVEAGERVRTWWHTTQLGENIQLIITSPLTRCIQTAVLAFLPGDEYGHCTPFVCMEGVREAFGSHFPDQRRSKSALMRHWPIVHFDRRMTEEDELWKPNEREVWDDITRRIDLFLEWLVRRREDNVVVVSHGVWIEHMFRIKCPEVTQHGQQRVRNLDAFACHCVSIDGKFQRLEHGLQI